MLKLETRVDLQRLVDEGLEESLVLEYKASPALDRQSKPIDELCKDVSAMANSACPQRDATRSHATLTAIGCPT
jgi:hypothetical protein